MKLTRRFLAVLLAFSMSLSMVTPAFASETETVAETEPAVVVEEIAEVSAEAAGDAAEDTTESSEEETSEPAEEVFADATIKAIEDPTGTEENPEIIWDPTSITVSLEEGDSDGYYYSFSNRAMTGTLVLTPNCADEAVEYEVIVTNGNVTSALSDSDDGTVSVEIAPGDVLTIWVGVSASEGVYSAAEITISGEVVTPVGSPENPEIIWDPSTAVISVPAGMNTGYYINFSNRAMTGTLVLAPTCAEEDVKYDIILTNTVSGETAWLSDSEDGTVSMDIVPGDIVSIQIGIEPDANWNYPAATISLNGSIEYPVGSSENPEIIWDPSTAVISVPAGMNAGYYINFSNRAMTGTLVLAPTCAEEDVEYDIILTNTVSGETVWLSDSEDGTVSMDIVPGDIVSIQIGIEPDANWNYPAATISLNGSIESPLGSSENPEIIWDPSTAVISVPAGMNAGYYINFSNRAMTGTLVLAPTCTEEDVKYDIILTNTVSGETVWLSDSEDGTVSMDIVPGDIVSIQIGIEPDANWNYPAATISLNGSVEYPLGTLYNPDTLQEGQNVTVLGENVGEGYLYTWTAPDRGELTITVSDGKAGWFYSISNLTAGKYGDNHCSYNKPLVYSETISVNKGDEISVVVNTCGFDMFDATPAGSVYFTAEFVVAEGAESNPIFPAFAWNEDYTEATVTVTVPAGTTNYYNIYNADGMYLSVDGGDPVVLSGNMFWMPAVFTVTNDSDEEAEFELHLYWPEGSVNNPIEIGVGNTVAELEEGSEGIYYSFIAPDLGEVTISMNDGEAGWLYCVNNMTSYRYGENHASTDMDDSYTPSETISVNAGDELVILINTDNGTWTAPAGSVSFDVSFEAAEVGSKANPIEHEWVWNDEHTEATAEVTVPAFTTYSYIYYGTPDMLMSIDGGEPVVMSSEYMGPMVPIVFSVTNDNWMEQTFSLHLYAPIGTDSNPDTLVMGKNTAVVSEGSQGYWYSWTATTSGYLSIAMDADADWTYAVCNDTSYKSTDTHWSDENPAVTRELIAITKGDSIRVMVNTYDPATWYAAPAGTVSFTASVITAYQNSVISGKSTTLKFIDPTTLKTVSASKVNWVLTEGDEAYASISTAGKLTAKKGITEPTTVTVVANLKADMSVSYIYEVTIYPAATAVAILDGEVNVSGKVATFDTNEMTSIDLDFSVESKDALQEVTWKSSNTKVATVDENGIVSAVWNEKTQSYKSGTVTITATAADGSGKKASVKITFKTTVDEIEITSKTGQLNVGAGKALNLIANVNADATNKAVTWAITEGADLATISSKGVLSTTKAKGLTTVSYVTVTATAQDSGKYVETATITVAPLAASVVINDNDDYLAEGNVYDMNTWWPEFYLNAAVKDANGATIDVTGVTWKSSNTKIATVDDGAVYCLKPGTVTITATANDGSGKKATMKISVVKSPSEIQMPASAVLAAGKTLTLKPTVLDADATSKTLEWTISENEIGATVKSGKVSANQKLVAALTKPVTLTVTATAQMADKWGEKASASCDITFYPATTKVNILDNDVIVTGKATNLDVGDTIVLSAESQPELAADVYTWTSSNTKIATVQANPDGSITVKPTGTKLGKVTITATAKDGTKKYAKVTINVVRAVQELTVSETGIEITAGTSLKLASKVAVNPTNASNKKVGWKVSENEIGAKISSSGVLTTNAKLVTEPVVLKVTAAAQDGFGATVTFTVTVNPAK